MYIYIRPVCFIGGEKSTTHDWACFCTFLSHCQHTCGIISSLLRHLKIVSISKTRLQSRGSMTRSTSYYIPVKTGRVRSRIVPEYNLSALQKRKLRIVPNELHVCVLFLFLFVFILFYFIFLPLVKQTMTAIKVGVVRGVESRELRLSIGWTWTSDWAGVRERRTKKITKNLAGRMGTSIRQCGERDWKSTDLLGTGNWRSKTEARRWEERLTDATPVLVHYIDGRVRWDLLFLRWWVVRA